MDTNCHVCFWNCFFFLFHSVVVWHFIRCENEWLLPSVFFLVFFVSNNRAMKKEEKRSETLIGTGRQTISFSFICWLFFSRGSANNIKSRISVNPCKSMIIISMSPIWNCSYPAIAACCNDEALPKSSFWMSPFLLDACSECWQKVWQNFCLLNYENEIIFYFNNKKMWSPTIRIHLNWSHLLHSYLNYEIDSYFIYSTSHCIKNGNAGKCKFRCAFGCYLSAIGRSCMPIVFVCNVTSKTSLLKRIKSLLWLLKWVE